MIVYQTFRRRIFVKVQFQVQLCAVSPKPRDRFERALVDGHHECRQTRRSHVFSYGCILGATVFAVIL